MLHQYENIPKVLEKYRVGTVDRDESYVFHTPLTKELRQKVKSVLPANQWWAPVSWYVLVLLSSTRSPFVIVFPLWIDGGWNTSY